MQDILDTWRETFSEIPDDTGQTSLWIQDPTTVDPDPVEALQIVEDNLTRAINGD